MIAIFALLLLVAVPAHAQTADTAVYTMTDVTVDVTADSAAHARDQALVQAQRSAFNQLLERLGVEANVGAKLSDDDIASLVKNYEMQNERRSSVRYIGVYTIQFKPNAVRTWLGGKNLSYVEQRSLPMLVLPILESNNRAIMWEQPNKWRAAWDAVPHDSGLVPVVVPPGNPDDAAFLTTQDAIDGKGPPLQGMIQKYQAGGAVVVTLKANLDTPTEPLQIEIQHFGGDGIAQQLEPLSLPPPTDKASLDAALAQGVALVRKQLEADWRHDLKHGGMATVMNDVAAPPPPDQQPGDETEISVQNQLDAMSPPQPLDALVPIATLAQWAQIKRKLLATPHIQEVNVITVQRGAVSIEMLYQGNIQDVQTELMTRNLQLKQDTMTGAWTLSPF